MRIMQTYIYIGTLSERLRQYTILLKDYLKKEAIIKIINIAIPKYIILMMVDKDRPKNVFCIG